MRSKRASSRSACSRTCVGHRRLGDLRAVLVDDGRLVLAELLADRVELLAQDVLALLLLHARVDVLADAAADLHRRSRSRWKSSASSRRSVDVEGLEQLDLLLERQVGRVAGRVGERAGLGDRAHEGGDAAVVAAQLEDLLDDRAVLALELAEALAGGVSSGRSSTSTSRRPWRRSRRRRRSRGGARQRRGGVAAGQADALGDLGDGADVGVLAVVPGDEQDALLVADVDRQGDAMWGRRRVVEGTSRNLFTIGFTLLGMGGSVGHTRTNYKNCSGIPAFLCCSLHARANAYGTRTNRRAGLGRLSSRSPASRNSPPGTGHRLAVAHSEGVTARGMGARSRVPTSVRESPSGDSPDATFLLKSEPPVPGDLPPVAQDDAHGTQPRKRRRVAAATLPARMSDSDGPAPP